MTEYWVSTPKQWCIYCKQFIQANKIGLANHEKSEKHKNSVKRYLADNKKKKFDEEQQDRQLQHQIRQIEQAAVSSMKRDGSYQRNSSPLSLSAATSSSPSAFSSHLSHSSRPPADAAPSDEGYADPVSYYNQQYYKQATPFPKAVTEVTEPHVPYSSAQRHQKQESLLHFNTPAPKASDNKPVDLQGGWVTVEKVDSRYYQEEKEDTESPQKDSNVHEGSDDEAPKEKTVNEEYLSTQSTDVRIRKRKGRNGGKEKNVRAKTE